jgi:arylsulfatase A-like enzyme
VSLLDVPATALALLGIPCPVSYHGRTIGHSPVDDVVRAA